MRNMSFALTSHAILDHTKTVTRRLGWRFLKPGEIIQPVYKCMGLKKGEKIKKLGVPIKIKSINEERLRDITQIEVKREGFPYLTPQEFIGMFRKHMNCQSDTPVTRIEFEYPESE